MTDWLDERPGIDERFEAFHRNNPRVFDDLEKLATEAFAAGVQRIGIRMLYEALRWQRMFETVDSKPFKLNNDYHSRYVRLLIAKHPEWSGRFATRRLAA